MDNPNPGDIPYTERRYRRHRYGARIDATKPSHHARYWPSGTWDMERLERGLERFADRIAWRRMLVHGEIVVSIHDLSHARPVILVEFDGFPDVEPEDRDRLRCLVNLDLQEVVLPVFESALTTRSGVVR